MGFSFNPFTGNLDLKGSGSSSVTAADVAYTPTTPSDWISPVPTQAEEALDDLASRLTGLVALNNTQQIYVDSVAGDDTTGTGSSFAPVETIQKAVTLVTDPSLQYVFFLAPGEYGGSPVTIPGNVSVIGTAAAIVCDVTLGVSPGDEIAPVYAVGLSNITMDLTDAATALPVFYNAGFNITRLDATTGPHFIQIRDGSVSAIDLVGNASFSNVIFVGTATVRNSGNMVANGCIIGINITVEELGQVSMIGCTFVGSITGTNSPPDQSIVTSDASSLSYGGTITDCIIQYADTANNIGYTPSTSGDWAVVPELINDALDELAGRTAASLTANRAVQTDGSGVINTSSVTATELGYVSGVTSAIQTQLNNKEATANKGVAGGYASLDGAGKVPVTQLPNSIMEYQGTWNASTNSPTLVDGSGSIGDVYRVTVAGTQDLGSGNITFDVGDYAILNSSLVWEKADATDAVISVNGYAGAVTLITSDISEGTNQYFTTERAQDAAGALATNSSKVSLTYNDGANTLTADIVAASLVNADINPSAAIDATKIADGSVSNTEFQYLNSVTSDIQTQFTGKASTALDNLASTALNADIIPATAATRSMGSTTLPFTVDYAENFRSGERNNISFTGDTTSGNATVLVTNTTGLAVNMHVAGSGIQLGAQINSIVTNTSITLSSTATATATGVSLLAAYGGSIRTGEKTSTAISGSYILRSGNTVDGNSGPVNVRSGNATGTGSSGPATFTSGSAVGSGVSGPVTYNSGTVVDGTSGAVTSKSGNASGTGSSGTAFYGSGTAVNGNSGAVTFGSGTVTGTGTSGNVQLAAGTATGGTRGSASVLGNTVILGGSGTIQPQLSIVPSTNNTRDLGSSALKFKDAYLGNSLVIEDPGAGTNNVTIQAAASTAAFTLTLPSALPGSTQAVTLSATGQLGTSAFATASAGDIAETSYTGLVNNTADQTITGFAFSNATVRSFQALVSVYIDATSDLYAVYEIMGIQRGSDWQITDSTTGDSITGFSFSITSAGQVRASIGNITGFSSATIKFRAQTTTV